MPPALFRAPYVLGFESEDLKQYIVTRGWECEAGLRRPELVDIILTGLLAEGRRVDWAVHTRRAGRMNLREKPTESEKKRERDEALMEGEGGTGKDSPSRYLEGMRADLEVGATPVDGLVASAMQDGKRLEKGIRIVPTVIPSKLWRWLWFRRHILSVPERCCPSERSCHKRGVGSSRWAVKKEEFPEHLQGQTYESALVEEFEKDIDQFREWILESPVVTVIRHTGDSRGELGVGVKKNVAHEADCGSGACVRD